MGNQLASRMPGTSGAARNLTDGYAATRSGMSALGEQAAFGATSGLARQMAPVGGKSPKEGSNPACGQRSGTGGPGINHGNNGMNPDDLSPCRHPTGDTRPEACLGCPEEPPCPCANGFWAEAGTYV